MDASLHREARIAEAVSAATLPPETTATTDLARLERRSFRPAARPSRPPRRARRRAWRAGRGSGIPSSISSSDDEDALDPERRCRSSRALSPANGAPSPSAIERGLTGTLLPGRQPLVQSGRELRLDGDDPRLRPKPLTAVATPGNQPAAADRDDDDVGVRHVLDELEPDRPLPGDHVRVVERVDERAACLLDELVEPVECLGRPGRRRGRPRRRSRAWRRPSPAFASAHMTSSASIPSYARSRRAPARGCRRRSPITPRARSSGVSVASFVEHSAQLERSGALEELGLQRDARAGQLGERRRAEHRCAVQPPADRLARGDDVVERISGRVETVEPSVGRRRRRSAHGRRRRRSRARRGRGRCPRRPSPSPVDLEGPAASRCSSRRRGSGRRNPSGAGRGSPGRRSRRSGCRRGRTRRPGATGLSHVLVASNGTVPSKHGQPKFVPAGVPLHVVDLLRAAVPGVADVHVAGDRVDPEAPRVPEAVVPDLAAGARPCRRTGSCRGSSTARVAAGWSGSIRRMFPSRSSSVCANAPGSWRTPESPSPTLT